MNAAKPARLGRANLLLDHLASEARERLLAGSRLEQLPIKRVLFGPQEVVGKVYFPLSGVVSLVTTMLDGAVIETATIGREGVVGMPMMLDMGGVANATAVSQVHGAAVTVRKELFRDEMGRGDHLYALVHEFDHALFTLVAQNVACNRLHNMVQRCARWLLMTHDRVGADEFFLTQEHLSQMLGSRRASVTQAVAPLRDTGAIRYRRGDVTILNRAALEAKACECYDVARNLFGCLYDRVPNGGAG